MKKINSNVACAGMYVHYKFSNVTFRDASGKVVSRQRLDHPDRKQLAERLSRWPRGIPVVMEASFGWGWLSDLVEQADQDVHLSNHYTAKGCLKKTKDEKRGNISLDSRRPFMN